MNRLFVDGGGWIALFSELGVMLSGCGAAVHSATSARGAPQRISTTHPDVLV